jgi:hypothetical protein
MDISLPPAAANRTNRRTKHDATAAAPRTDPRLPVQVRAVLRAAASPVQEGRLHGVDFAGEISDLL